MATYKQGDVVRRFGTLGARRDPEQHVVVILAVNQLGRIRGEQFYTCALLTASPPTRGRATEIAGENTKKAYIRFDYAMLSGESSLKNPDPTQQDKVGELSPSELISMRGTLDALLSADKNHFGKVVYSVTPSHDGVRGKPNRPYVLLSPVGKDSSAFFAVPVSSSPASTYHSHPIENLSAAGLNRDAGEASYLREDWLQTVDLRTASQPSGRLDENDRRQLYKAFSTYKKQLVAGEIGSAKNDLESAIQSLSGNSPRPIGAPSPTSMFPSGCLRAPSQPIRTSSAPQVTDKQV